jgi:hypothetical protein
MIKFKQLLESKFDRAAYDKLNDLESDFWSAIQKLKAMQHPELNTVIDSFNEALSDLTILKDKLRQKNNINIFE